MTSRENLSYNHASSSGVCRNGTYKTLEQAGLGQLSPSSCMSDYGTRSVRDTMDWEIFLKNNTRNATAVPGLINGRENYMKIRRV